MKLCIDNYELDQFHTIVQAFGSERYGYVVTPNVDHLIRYSEDPAFRDVYADATYVLFDSRFLAKWLKLTRNLTINVCPGSDLTQWILESGVAAADRLVLVGATAAQARQLVERYGLRELLHIEVPMGFVHDEREVNRCLELIEASSPFRYCFMAVGSPQQELLSRQLKLRAKAHGLSLCVGASINYLTGTERRAPGWLQRLGLEWLFRLSRSPGRLAKRYLVRGPRIFTILPRIQFVLRRGAADESATMS
jgi:exopolysaccharide biosynthesis WecB/TagA/CpsF family protein